MTPNGNDRLVLLFVKRGCARDYGFARLVHVSSYVVPVADASIVLRHGGIKAVAFGIHGVTALVMLIAVTLLLS
jgi:hypothetical protein